MQDLNEDPKTVVKTLHRKVRTSGLEAHFILKMFNATTVVSTDFLLRSDTKL